MPKIFSKGCERSVYWNEYKTKCENKNTTKEYIYFLKSNFVGVYRVFVLVDKNQDFSAKRFKTQKYYLPKGIIENVIINGKNVYDQAIDSDIKGYEEIRKLTTSQSEDYTKRCLLDYDCIKNHYLLITVNLSKQKELDASPKAIQQIELVGQLKKLDDDDDHTTDAAGNDQSIFILAILEKIQEMRLAVL